MLDPSQTFESLNTIAPQTLFVQLGLSLLLGLLVGLQRERVKAKFGMRTFPLITLLGTLCALLSTQFGLWILPAGLFCLTLTGLASVVLPISMHQIQDRTNGTEKTEPVYEFGTTTLITIMVMFCVGAMLANPRWTLLALEIGGITAVLLQFKLELHHIAERFGENDMKAIMQFVMITFVILPLLPNKNMGPYGSFNPFETWLMVVLIVGMSLSGYIIYKFFGQNAGIFMGGAFGGAISSTATTVCYSRMVASKAITAPIAVIVLLVAASFLMIRSLLLIVIISPQFMQRCFVPLFIMMICSVVPALFLWHRVRKTPFTMVEQANPTQWSSALTFAFLYALISFAMKAGSQYLGTGGLYLIAAVSGFTETSAITISTARMALNDPGMMENGWKIVMIAILANFSFKFLASAMLAGWRFALRVVLLFLPAVLAGILLLKFY
ncbi:MAG: MgtC/SapB family protein [Planctomycetia bacterium]|nr:MgtC/SapB family protein [Planctomycetia bacterium]